MSIKTMLVGTYDGQMPVHHFFNSGIHELTDPVGQVLQTSAITIQGTCSISTIPNSPIFIYVIAKGITLPAELPISRFWNGTAPTMTLTIVLETNGSEQPIGNIVFNGQTFADVTFLNNVDCLPGDKIIIKSPASGGDNSVLSLIMQAKLNRELIPIPAENLSYTSDGEGITITGFDESMLGLDEEIDLIIPSHINGIPVVAIGDYAFAQTNP
jgi:hypothetical protein